MNKLHQGGNVQPSTASSAASNVLRQKALALASLAWLFPLAILFSTNTAERLLLAVRQLFSA